MTPSPPSDVVARLEKAIATTRYTSGATHHFYHYPARFAPEVARTVIDLFSRPDDWVMDPFMGGGTSMVEGLMMGRRMIGSDLNALACFVSSVRTQPLSPRDVAAIQGWVRLVGVMMSSPHLEWVIPAGVRNLPRPVDLFVSGALALTAGMLSRQQAFARCALLRLGQWALDCRDFSSPGRKRLARQLPTLVEGMLSGLREFVNNCKASGIGTGAIRGRRLLLHRSAVGIDEEPILHGLKARPRLVLTSPPYPGVHVLYHRWQYRGRRETSAPYWIASVPDGCGTSFYCGGSRTPTGLRNYFQMITDAFKSVRNLVSPSAVIVQLVGFSDMRTQLPLYLNAMTDAGFDPRFIESGIVQDPPLPSFEE